MAQTNGRNVHVPSRFTVPSYLLALDVLHPICPSDFIVSNMVSAHAASSWGVHYGLKLELRKQVETALANSCPWRDLLSTRNLVESSLVSDAYAMKDVVIGALSRKRPRHNVTKGGRNKEAPLGKRAML